MKIMATGLDDTTVIFMREHGAIVERQEVEGVEDLKAWIQDGLYDAAVIELEKSRLGVYVARGFRTNNVTTPIVGISRGSDSASWSDYRATFLENGGDDLLRGPTNPRELMASLRVVMRRFQGALLDFVQFEKGQAGLKVNLTKRTIYVNDEQVKLSGKELSMMLLFASNPGRVMSKETILGQMYTEGVEDEPEVKIIDVFVCKLRKKLTDVHPDATFIETIWGRGYRLAVPTTAGGVSASMSELMGDSSVSTEMRSLRGRIGKGAKLF